MIFGDYLLISYSVKEILLHFHENGYNFQILNSIYKDIFLLFMIEPGKIQSHNSPQKDSKDGCDEVNTQNTNDLNNTPTFDFPPGYEHIFRSKQTLPAPSDENNDLSFPPGFGKTNFTGSLPANIFLMKPKISNDVSINTTQNDKEQNSPDDFKKSQPDKANNESIDSTCQEQPQQVLLDKESNENLIPSFQNLVYNIESSEPFQPHSKPDLSKYDKLALCSNLLSIKNFKSEKDQIEKMISAECQLCENKIHKFVDELGQRNKKIENMFQDLSQKVSECTTSKLSKKKSSLQIDDIVDTRNEIEIANFLREQSGNDILTLANNDESNARQTPKQETILNLLSILCRIYTKDKELAIVWVKNALACINQVTDNSRLKPILLEIKRVMCNDKETSDELKDISNLIDSKLC